MIRTVNEANRRSRKLTSGSLIYQKLSQKLINTFPYLPSHNKYHLSISHKKKFIWFRVAKTGTRTIFDVLERANINLDAEHPFNCYYPVSLYKNYFKFAFVRNPWDRLVSCWADKVCDTNHWKFPEDKLLKMQDFRNFVDFVAEKNLENCDGHIRLQSKLIDLNNIDYLGRFEDFEKHLLRIMDIIKIEAVNISHKNASKNKSNYRDYYDEELKQKVYKLYERDINIFAYEF